MSDSLAPGFLIAFPHLLDPNFRQSVVLLLEQSADGAMGIVINRESPLLLRDLCQDHEIPYSGDEDKVVRAGGPVQPEQGLVLYGADHVDSEGQEIQEGLYVSASRATLARLCSLKQVRFECYAGHAGWGPGQLEHELTEGAWLLSRGIDPRMILERPAREVWAGCLHAMGIDPATLVPGGGQQA